MHSGIHSFPNRWRRGALPRRDCRHSARSAASRPYEVLLPSSRGLACSIASIFAICRAAAHPKLGYSIRMSLMRSRAAASRRRAPASDIVRENSPRPTCAWGRVTRSLDRRLNTRVAEYVDECHASCRCPAGCVPNTCFRTPVERCATDSRREPWLAHTRKA